MKNTVLRDVTQCGSCKNRHFRGAYRLHHNDDGGRIFLRNVRPCKSHTVSHARRLQSSVLQLSLFWTRPIQSTPTHPICTKSILILSAHLRLCLPNGLFPFGYPIITYTRSFSLCISSDLCYHIADVSASGGLDSTPSRVMDIYHRHHWHDSPSALCEP
jgi:hypothetical protein